MGSLISLTLILLSWILSATTKIQAHDIKSAHLLDLLIRDYTFKSYNKQLKTGTLQTIHLPANFSGIQVETARFRCGSLRRYGSKFKEFHLGIGITIHPCVERVMVVKQNLGYNWSSIYYANYDLSGYQLISPVLGLLAYNAGTDLTFTNPFELSILSQKNPITIHFGNFTNTLNASTKTPLCATFESNGKVTLSNQVFQHTCEATKHGHFGLVMKLPPSPAPAPVQVRKKISKWKMAVGTSIGGSMGVFLLGLLLVAMCVRVKKRSRMVEMERRAYEEEALQVSMVGHVRAPMAAGTRTYPTIEYEYRPPPS